MPRTYVVTGAASGTGAALRRLLQSNGHRVIGVDLHNSDIKSDLSMPTGRLEAVEQVIDLSQGSVDAVVTCAGIAAAKPLTLSVNFFGATQFVEGLHEVLVQSCSPRVAMISSASSLLGVDNELVGYLLAGSEPRAIARAQELVEIGPDFAKLIYTSSKQALSAWVQREAPKKQWAGAGIALNAVAPGTVLTPMTETAISTAAGRAEVDAAIPMPLNYHVQPDEIAQLLAWLVSKENTHVTGQTIFIDGGAHAVLMSRQRHFAHSN
jgi:NAD(P)-dependent dehydrogenase (short-subunit alcohol dehydrogenase family)